MKASEMLFWSRNRMQLVPAGHPEAHTQAFAEGEDIPDEHALKVVLGVKNKMQPAPMRKSIDAEK